MSAMSGPADQESVSGKDGSSVRLGSIIANTCVAAILLLLAATQILPPEYMSPTAIAVGSLSLTWMAGTVLLCNRTDGVALATATFFGTFLAFYMFAGTLYSWPFHLLVPLCAAVAVSAMFGGRTAVRALAGIGVWNVRSVWLAVAIGFVGAVTLGAWTAIFQPDLAAARSMIPSWPAAALIAGAIGFALLNALLEEVVWRSLLLRWLLGRTAPILAIIVQALSFGAAHWNGVPGGPAGAILTTIFGLLLGVLAYRTRGIGLAVLAHALADIAVFALLAWSR